MRLLFLFLAVLGCSEKICLGYRVDNNNVVLGRALVEQDAEEERERIKEEVAEEMADYLYSFIKTSAHGGGGGGHLYPGQAFEYGSSGLRDPVAEVAAAERLLYKKSVSGGGGGDGAAGGGAKSQQAMIYHQCYFNPISCFKKKRFGKFYQALSRY